MSESVEPAAPAVRRTAQPSKVAAPEQLMRQALALHRQGRLREAEGIYFAVAQAVPRHFQALHNIGLVRLQQGDPMGAIRLLRQAIQVNPRSVEAYNNLGGALQAINRQEEALKPYEAALALNPNFADGHNNIGAALKSLGRIEEALAAFEKATALAPTRPAFFRNLIDTRKIEPGDRHLAIMERIADQMDKLSIDDRIQLHFALSKAYDDTGQKELSFRHQLAGNVLKRQQIVYDEGNTVRAFERTASVFTAELMRSRQGVGNPSETPVFICGMPRSGTTLVEQILASHPAAFGAGELMEFEMMVASLGNARGRMPPFPQIVPELSDDRLREIGNRYVQRVEGYARNTSARRVTDKMPANFRYLGLINLALPNARIIHLNRDPVDNCLSCFSILFMGGQPHVYELGELGRYYRAYTRLMDHWRAVLPPGVLLDVQYEDVVNDLEGQARRLLAHCGLEWDDACISFHKTERPIRTASAMQVRLPIYRTSVGRWRPAAEILQPLTDALGV